MPWAVCGQTAACTCASPTFCWLLMPQVDKNVEREVLNHRLLSGHTNIVRELGGMISILGTATGLAVNRLAPLYAGLQALACAAFSIMRLCLSLATNASLQTMYVLCAGPVSGGVPDIHPPMHVSEACWERTCFGGVEPADCVCCSFGSQSQPPCRLACRVMEYARQGCNPAAWA